eukprot:jgi/Tetstr1/450218/TSEL_037256.t1
MDPPIAALIDVVDYLRVVAPTALAMLLCNVDRICMSIAIIPMAVEFAWPASVQGLVSASFLWGYMATQLLGGSLADKYGAKRTMAAAIIWFSLASLIMPLALSGYTQAAGLTLTAIMLARGAVGLGEGVVLPSMNSLLARTIPQAQRSSALGAVFTGFHCGNLVGLALTPFLLQVIGWRGVFIAFGLLGVPMLLMWQACVPRQDPQAATPAQAAAGSAGARDVSVMEMLSKRAVWAIVIVNFINHWGYFIYLNWLPSYFNTALGFDLRASSLLSFLPWAVMALGSLCSGALVDAALQAGYPLRTVRRTVQTVAFAGPVAALLLLANQGTTASPTLAVLCFVATLGISSLGQAGFVANMSDIAPRHAGRLFGLCNTFGSFAGIVGVSAVGFIVELTGSFAPVFFITAALYVIGIICWNLLLSTEVQF